MQCPTCQTTFPDGTVFCPECGSRVPTGTTPESGVPMRVLQDRYVLTEKLGQGGMGAVYRASDRRLSTAQWAIKELSDAALNTSDERIQARTLFRHEAELLAGLSHPNLPRVTDHFEQENKNYLVMELVPGETLLDFVNRSGLPQPADRVFEWAGQLCDVLDYLHRQQPPIIFRDLKPANIMLTPNGSLKLIDFGIARLFKPGQAKDTQAFGTAGYSAPEQYGRGQTDARSDVYSLGVVLYQLLTGYDPTKTPFRLPPANQVNAQVSPQVGALLARATNTDPAQRFPDMRAFRDALSAANGRSASIPSGPAVPPPPYPHADAQRVSGSTLLAQSALWSGVIATLFNITAVIGMIMARATGGGSSNGWSGLGFLTGMFGLLIIALTGVLSVIALLSQETKATMSGRRHAIIGIVLSGASLVACCMATILTPSST